MKRSLFLTLVICVALTGVATAQTTIWQIGTEDGGAVDPTVGAAEFPANYLFDLEYTYVVGTDDDPVTSPTARGYIGTDNVCDISSRPLCTDTARTQTIQFDFDCGHDDVTLVYGRYGSEEDLITFDGQVLTNPTDPPGEGKWKLFEFDLGYVPPGSHEITIQYAGGGDNNGHYIDFLRLNGVRRDCSEEASLCAGQDSDIGMVNVTNDAEFLYVTFNITEPGWYIDETHVAVGTDPSDLPQTKKNNPIPGQFPYACDLLEPMQQSCTATIPLGDWCDGTGLFVAAHAAVVHVAGDGCCETVFWANTVEGYDQGTLKNGNPVTEERDDPTDVFALGGFFYSLGLDIAADGYADGWLTVGFGNPIYNGPGDDVVIQEVTNGRSNYPLEHAEVFGVNEGTDYFAGTVDNERNVPGGDGFVSIGFPDGTTTFDFVKLLDSTDPSIHKGNADGYDVDAVGACWLYLGEETAWGDGCYGTRFAEKGSWGTYFEFTVNDWAVCEPSD